MPVLSLEGRSDRHHQPNGNISAGVAPPFSPSGLHRLHGGIADSTMIDKKKKKPEPRIMSFNYEFAPSHGLQPLEDADQQIHQLVDRIKHFFRWVVRSSDMVRIGARKFTLRCTKLGPLVRQKTTERTGLVDAVLAAWTAEEKRLRKALASKLIAEPWRQNDKAEMNQYSTLQIDADEKKLVVKELYFSHRTTYLKRFRVWKTKVAALRRHLSHLKSMLDYDPMGTFGTEPGGNGGGTSNSADSWGEYFRIRNNLLESVNKPPPRFVFTPETITFDILVEHWKQILPALRRQQYAQNSCSFSSSHSSAAVSTICSPPVSPQVSFCKDSGAKDQSKDPCDLLKTPPNTYKPSPSLLGASPPLGAPPSSIRRSGSCSEGLAIFEKNVMSIDDMTPREPQQQQQQQPAPQTQRSNSTAVSFLPVAGASTARRESKADALRRRSMSSSPPRGSLSIGRNDRASPLRSASPSLSPELQARQASPSVPRLNFASSPSSGSIPTTGFATSRQAPKGFATTARKSVGNLEESGRFNSSILASQGQGCGGGRRLSSLLATQPSTSRRPSNSAIFHAVPILKSSSTILNTTRAMSNVSSAPELCSLAPSNSGSGLDFLPDLLETSFTIPTTNKQQHQQRASPTFATTNSCSPRRLIPIASCNSLPLPPPPSSVSNTPPPPPPPSTNSLFSTRTPTTTTNSSETQAASPTTLRGSRVHQLRSMASGAQSSSSSSSPSPLASSLLGSPTTTRMGGGGDRPLSASPNSPNVSVKECFPSKVDGHSPRGLRLASLATVNSLEDDPEPPMFGA